MNLPLLDVLIVALYLGGTMLIGLLLKKKAQACKRSYILGGNRLPWYLLGLSNASVMFDISGTLWLVTMLFVYGLKSVWLPWLWPVFNQIFLMVFLSVWIRRSHATTGAEWMRSRFGSGRGGHQAHIIVVVFALIMALGFMTYAFIGLGKFVELFIPWEMVSPYVPFTVSPQYVPHFYGIVFISFATFYALLGGMMGVVWADLVQYIIMSISAVVIGVIAACALQQQPLAVPEGWGSPWFGWSLHMDWASLIPEVNHKIAEDGFSLFSIFFMMMLFKGVLASLAGPAPASDLQKILSTRNEREAALMSGSVSVILMPIRYVMITGFVVLGLLYYEHLNIGAAGVVDFERIMPAVVSEFVPSGFLGLLLAGLLAAFISTFASTLNAAQAYVVNDLFLKYINPEAGNRSIALINYLAGGLIITISIVFGFYAKDVNDVLQWIVSSLYGSYVAANLLKWYWWRFNGRGYLWGMLGGLVPALTFRYIFGGVLDLYTFPLMLLISLIACILGTYTAPPVERETLVGFYKTVRPWGFWRPVHAMVLEDDPDFVNDSHFRRDCFNIAVGIFWQTVLVLCPIYAVLLRPVPAALSLFFALLSSFVLYHSWYRKLPSK